MKPTTAVAVAAALSAALSCGTAASASAASAASSATTPPPVSQQREDGQGCVGGSHVVAPGTPWAVRALDLARAQQLGTGGGVTVAVLDTGVQTGAARQLAGQVTDGPHIEGPAGRDCVGHGTFVAGLIAARPGTGNGFVGIAPGAHVYALAVTDDTGATSPGAIAAGIDAAVAAHARVIDVSVATTTGSAKLTQAVRHATAAGSLVVAPATADDQTQAAPVYPAACPGVLSVAATGSDGVLPGSEAIGAPVDLVAPGEGVTGVGPGGGDFTGTGAGYAAAYVAGAAALVDSYRGPLSPAALVQRLEATALHPGTALPSPAAGYGELDPLAAMSTLPPTPTAPAGHHAPPAARLTVARPPAPSTRDAALAVAAAGLAVVALVALTALTITRGRRRGWRPGV